jgi:uncharacterized protein YndB with AHSA1/START domain
MADPKKHAGSPSGTMVLVVRKTIRATPEHLFEAWTQPAQLEAWWGPEGVACVGPQVELRVGGRYRIGNRFADGSILWIVGEFEVIEPPHLLTFTWRREGIPDGPERVTVRFEARGESTEVIVTHERIANEKARDQHERGWRGCLDSLADHVGAAAGPRAR